MDSLKLAANQVDIWHIDLDGHDKVPACRRLLSPDEIERADRFHFEKHQRRFAVGRAALRQILGGYAGLAPENLVFSYGPKGKPELAGGLQSSGIQFNLSHSSNRALLAVTHGLIVGADIEWINVEFATEDIAERFFSATEVAALQSLPRSERAEAFFSCWTRKEAYIKALGEGLSVPLDSFVVAFVPGVPAALLEVKVDPTQVSRWRMYNLEAPEGYKAALVVEGENHQLHLQEWN